jgi:4-hydroxy-tetrahydrodipicolinate synthase
MNELYGTGVALITPFEGNGSVDYKGLERLVEHQIKNGINYLVVLGTTGEPATLSFEEKELVKQHIINVNDGRIPLVLGIGGNNTAAVVHEIQQTDLADFTAVLSVSPYYNRPNQEGLYQHFKAISRASSKPIIVYNVPGRTGSNMEAETVIRLAEDFENIIGIKEAKGDMVQAMRLIKGTPDNFMVISGDDMIALPMVLAGGVGVISVIGQAFPKDFANSIQQALNGEIASANELQYKLMDAIDLIFEEGNPGGIKSLLASLQICSRNVRLPLVESSYELQQKISNFVADY